MKIETGFHGADLFTEDDEGYDVPESAALYAKLLKEEIEKVFPEAEVVINYDLDAGGVLPCDLQTRIDDIGAAEAGESTMIDLMVIENIEAQLYSEFKWMVNTTWIDEELELTATE